MSTSHHDDSRVPRSAVREALRRLDVTQFVFAVHEAALPSAPGLETGRGSLGSRGGLEFLESVHALGFDTVQLGPSGMTGRGNPSPYDGTLFSRSLLSADLFALATDPQWGGLLAGEEIENLFARLPDTAAARVPYRQVFDAFRNALGVAGSRFARARAAGRLPELAEEYGNFVSRNGHWLEGDALYEALASLHGNEDWRRWPSRLDRQLWDPSPEEEDAARTRRLQLREIMAEAVDSWSFAQFVLDRQRRRARKRLGEIGLSLFGDVQVGMSPRDAWRWQSLFLPGYYVGAPPSRTNPEGQPWGYPVFAPTGVFADGSLPREWPASPNQAEAGPVLRFVELRFERAFEEYDALRIDHPHGLVCPWVYRAEQRDPYQATRDGARLFSSPDVAGHPELAPYSIPRPEQIDHTAQRWADDRVRDLDERQVARYAAILDRVLELAGPVGPGMEPRLVCEVLSTMPYPLERVMRRRAMGRFRVIHKASLEDPADVYRSENARPEDWMMLSTQDTPSIWQVFEEWDRTAHRRSRCEHLAARLGRTNVERERLAREFASDTRRHATGMLAEMFACRARHVLVFFTDLFGITEPYNRPGVESPLNWTLRAPPLRGPGRGTVHLDIPGACILALRARGLDDPDLVSALENPGAS